MALFRPAVSRQRPRHGRGRVDVLTALSVLAVVVLLHLTTDVFGSLERRFYDQASTASDRVPSDRIAVIAIDDASIERIGRWPWPRDVHAQLIDRLTQAGAKTIAHTAFFFEPQTDKALGPLRELRSQIETGSENLPDLGPLARERLLAYLGDAETRLDADARLADSILRSNRVILPSVFDLGEPRGRPDAPLPAFAQRGAVEDISGFGLPAMRTQQPLPALGEAAVAVGHLNQWLDDDGAVRREALLLQFDGFAVPSMALSIATHSLNLSAADISLVPGAGLTLGPSFIPTDASARVLPQFYADRAGVSAFSPDAFHAVLSGEVPAEKFRDKIVIIGATAAGVGTAFNTPVSPAMSPAAIVAHMTSSLLKGHFIEQPTWAAASVLAVGLLITLYLAFALPRLSAAAGAALTALLLLGLLGSEYLLLARASTWVPLVLPAALLLLGHLALTTRRFLLTEAGKRRSDEESAETNRMMGLALQGQGQLDMAFDRFRRVPYSEALMDNLKHLALDFERKRQFNRAEAVYAHMAQLDHRDDEVKTRMQRAQQLSQTVVLGGGGKSHPGGTLLLDAAGVEQPMLGRYRVEKELGKGAMGVVYQGRDPKIGRTVAIKTLALSAEFEGTELQEARARFFREAETAGRLQHPHIVTIYDAGEEHDLAYIAMEFLNGHDLSAHTRPGQLLPAAEVLRIGEQVALALDHAHRQNVVHRDIKPANVMRDPATGQIKVTDFGIARITDSSRTRTGVVLGTPSFMSPEQLAGQHVDGRSDLYSLGAMLFQLLTGELPLKADSLAALMYRIANEPAPDVRSLRPELPAALSALLAQALAKRPEQRPASGAVMAAELRRMAEALATEEGTWAPTELAPGGAAHEPTQPLRREATASAAPDLKV